MTNWQMTPGGLYVPPSAADGAYVAIKDGVRFTQFGHLVDGDGTTVNVDPLTGEVSVDASFTETLPVSIIDAKGDLIVGSDDNVAVRKPVGTDGQTIVADSSSTGGVKWASAGSRTPNAQTGTSYALVLTDAGKFITMTNAAASTLTVPPNSSVAFPIGTVIEGAQYGAGQLTLTPGAGVTINATPGRKIAAQYGSFALIKLGTDEWLAMGRLSA